MSHFAAPPPSPTHLEYVLGDGTRGRDGPGKPAQNHQFFCGGKFCNWLLKINTSHPTLRPVKIALIGYGKMGKAVEKLALHRGHTITTRLEKEKKENDLQEAEICIDFSESEAVLEHVDLCIRHKKPLIIGTTGWEKDLEKVRAKVEGSSIGVLYSPNFSIGVHLFLKAVHEVAKLMNPFENYDVAGFEWHHNQKQDSPSGTAKAVVNILLKEIARKKRPLFDAESRKVEKEELQFTSLRLGSIPGTHEVLFDSPHDTLSLKHEARSRDGFAEGALMAAEWLKGKIGFYTIEDMLWKGSTQHS